MKTLFTFRQLALGIWLGSLLMLGIAVAGPLFQLSPSKSLAGAINSVVLHHMNVIEWCCGLVALASSTLICLKIRRVQAWLYSVGGIIIMLILLGWYSIVLSGRMNTLRESIGDFDHPRTDATYIQQKSEFDTLHHRYTAIVGVNMLLIVAEFVWGSRQRVVRD